MTAPDLARLRALAEAAKASWLGSTPGWYVDPDASIHLRPEDSGEDVAMVVAVSPDVVLALLAEAEAAREMRELAPLAAAFLADFADEREKAGDFALSSFVSAFEAKIDAYDAARAGGA